MKTPIYDFVQNYLKKDPTRLHMPGHKGIGPLGIEQSDITEIDGADVLYHEKGILKESQENASFLFGSAKTLYSTEGATLCIRAMLAMVRQYADENGKKPIIAASRNAHKSFITGCALMDLDPIWIENTPLSLFGSKMSENDLVHFLSFQKNLPCAVYLTSPDYLGNMIDIKAIANICHENGILLIVDNAHGAYLHFLAQPCHPLDFGADLVCDSAHKTFPVLTGGAYLHISKNAPKILQDYAASAMALFASTSPSYLILQSLDLCNSYLVEYNKKLFEFCAAVFDVKKELRRSGFQLIGNEPLKITILTKSYGYTGLDFSRLLKNKNLIAEFADPDFVVLMVSPEQGITSLKKICKILTGIAPRKEILEFPPQIPNYSKIISPREALLSAYETLPVDQCLGRILSQPSITCPPAIPIAICGEQITKEHLLLFKYYGIEELSVKK